MSFIKNLFSDPPKPSIPKPPSTSSSNIQAAQDNARRMAALQSGRRSTILTGNNLGNVG